MSFGNFVECVNRTTRPLEGTFDGQSVVLPAGYVEADGLISRAVDDYGRPVVTVLPANVAALVRAQNPRMGTQDASSPRPDEYLIGISKWPSGTADAVDHVEQSDAIELLDRDSVSREGVTEIIPARGRGRRGRAAVAQKTRTGIAASYDD